MGFKDLLAKRKENAKFLESLKEEINGTEITFSHKYKWVWGQNNPSIIKIYESLLEGEEVERLTLGCGNSTKCVAITNKRIISAWKMGLASFEARWEDIRSATPSGVFTSGKVSTIHNEDALLIEWDTIEAKIKDKFYDYIQKKIHERRDSQNANSNAQPNNALDDLKKLKELLDAGIITQEEFDDKKKALLDNI